MRAAFFEGRGRIEVRDTPNPVCPPGGLLTRVEACAICGTDVRSFRYGSKNQGQIIGHETVGTVIEVGEGVVDWKVGDTVVDCPVSCRECVYCLRGEDNLCSSRGRVGGRAQGGFAELRPVLASAVSGGFVIKIPEDVPCEEATLIEPLACCLNGNERLNIGLDSTVAIIGSGPIGVLHLLLAKLEGARKSIIVDVKAPRLELASAFGPDVLVDASLVEPVDKVLEETDGRGADCVIVACVSQAAQRQAVEMAAKRGQVLLFAGLPDLCAMVSLDTNLIHKREITVLGARNSVKRQWDQALQLITSGRIPASRIVTHTVPLEQIGEGFALVKRGEALKVAVRP